MHIKKVELGQGLIPVFCISNADIFVTDLNRIRSIYDFLFTMYFCKYKVSTNFTSCGLTLSKVPS